MDQSFTKAVCPVCSRADSHFIRKYHYHHPIFAACSIVQCNHCKMVFANPMPGETELHQYNSAYFTNAHGGANTDKLGVAFHSAINLARVLHVEDFQQQHKKQINRVLEIGPGGGHFARHWLKKHPGTEQYTGIESDTGCHAQLSALGVTTSTDIDLLNNDGYFDLVVISHVLEHSSDPAKFLISCTKQLAAGGILFIEVPCKDFEHKDIDEPHLLFFDKEPMHLLLSKIGFDSIKLSYHGNTITELKRKPSFLISIGQKFRHLFLRMGILFPFSIKEKGLYGVDDPMERAMLKPFKAHTEQTEPSWWLRAVAVKN